MTKLEVCENALKHLPDNGLIGMGAGSTINLFLEQLKGYDLTLVCANEEIKSKAKSLGLKTIDSVNEELVMAFDGADYVDPENNLIKGYGKALFKEKIIDYNSRKVFILVEKRKLVDSLIGFEVPVEVHPLALSIVQNQLVELGAEVVKVIDGLTEQGNNLIHCRFNESFNPRKMEASIKLIPGVIESGLFTRKNVRVITD